MNADQIENLRLALAYQIMNDGHAIIDSLNDLANWIRDTAE